MKMLKQLALVALVCCSQSMKAMEGGNLAAFLGDSRQAAMEARMRAQEEDLHHIVALSSSIARLRLNIAPLYYEHQNSGYVIPNEQIVNVVGHIDGSLSGILNRIMTTTRLEEELSHFTPTERSLFAGDVYHAYESLSKMVSPLSAITQEAERSRVVANSLRVSNSSTVEMMKELATSIARLAHNLQQSRHIDNECKQALASIDKAIADAPDAGIFQLTEK